MIHFTPTASKWPVKWLFETSLCKLLHSRLILSDGPSSGATEEVVSHHQKMEMPVMGGLASDTHPTFTYYNCKNQEKDPEQKEIFPE